MAPDLDSPGHTTDTSPSGHPHREAPLRGLVLAGGRSARMGRDKGLLVYHRMAQVLWTRRLLSGLCEEVYVSINPEQRSVRPYDRLAVLVDRQPDRGPAAGLLSAWEALPGSAWLAVAVDLPFLTADTLAALVAGRDPAGLATAFRHTGGVLEPVCTLWEPAARAALTRSLASGDGSLRRVLEAGPTVVLPPPAPAALMSVNTPEEYRRALQTVAPEEGSGAE